MKPTKSALSLTPKQVDRFWSKVKEGDGNACWEWMGAKINGYGRFRFGLNGRGRSRFAHRFAWEIFNNRAIPSGMVVCHCCDNRGCVRPSHLFLGTQKQNMRDAGRKGRLGCGLGMPSPRQRGEQNPSAKLTVEDVCRIRSLRNSGRIYREIAEEYGISKSHVQRIVCGVSWRELARKKTEEEFFWSRVGRNTEESCWEWTGGHYKSGYGYFRWEGKSRLSHRLAWELSVGPIPNGLFVCHTCNNPSCINPRHLFLGSQEENMQHMVQEGRHRGNAKLNEEDILEIRHLYSVGVPVREIAEKFQIHSNSVWRCVTGKAWSRVGKPLARRNKSRMELKRGIRRFMLMDEPINISAIVSEVLPLFGATREVIASTVRQMFYSGELDRPAKRTYRRVK